MFLYISDKCKQLHSIKDDDGLDSLVCALPPSYTSRFGEIVWAAGGNDLVGGPHVSMSEFHFDLQISH
jgi:hypothetical protein